MNTKSERAPRQRKPAVVKAAFLITEVGFLSALAVWGGPAWVGVVVPAIFIEVYCGSQLRSFGMLMPAGIWLVLCTLTGNRELFFPFAMYVMAFMVSRLWERGPGAAAMGGFFCGSLFLLHSVAPERDHECALSRRSRCCWHRSYSYCLLLAGTEQGVDAIHWIGWRIADGLCRSCPVTLQYLPATQHPTEGQNQADDCCQHDPKRLRRCWQILRRNIIPTGGALRAFFQHLFTTVGAGDNRFTETVFTVLLVPFFIFFKHVHGVRFLRCQAVFRWSGVVLVPMTCEGSKGQCLQPDPQQAPRFR